MLRLEMLPAQFGDALWLEYGPRNDSRVVIVDCGFKSNYRELKQRIEQLRPGQLELLVLTHIDDDHIRGAIPLLADAGVTFPSDMEVWFNGWKHLTPSDELGAAQGEIFGALIERGGMRWNSSWGGRSVVIPDAGELPSGMLPGGLKWTLLSPNWQKLADLRTFWRSKVAELGLEAGDAHAFLELFEERSDLQPDDTLGDGVDIDQLTSQLFEEDDKAPNGSSIALLVEFEGKSILLAGDAHPGLLTHSLRRLARQQGRSTIAVDAFKVAHHGSRKNTSPELLRALTCRRFLFSSNGAKHGHPSPECVARIVKSAPGATLHFNYRSATNRCWDDSMKQSEHGYRALYPEDGGNITEL
ncbi:ComEC/Rec2 family competence protein [Peristeroidobacter agariperforans]|uniref:ComEC/Rec2 family competence protein n=1 Tax=Peristeroidobacter agariperforans TaxID=268404 RepID=UPI00101CCD2B|nr:MBL fold metallo-hydrolase [Peristeroidobacter agariperforans]